MKKLLFIFSTLFFGIIQAQYTAIPDPFFEQILIDKNIDSDGVINAQVLTSDISNITYLQLSGSNSSLSNLQGIQDFVSLNHLIVSGFQYLYNLDLSGNINLKKLHLFSTCFASINTSNNPLLEELHVFSPSLLLSFDLSNNTNLTSLALMNSWLTNLDVSSNINLKHLGLYGNSISTIDLSNNSMLETLDLAYNNINSLDLSANLLLKVLYVEHNMMLGLNIENNSFLEMLVCSNNNFYSLNLDNNPNLNKLYCADNPSLVTLSIKNGNNTLLNGTYLGYDGNYYNRFNSINCPNLQCIYVDNISNCETNWLGVDATSHFVTTQQECELLSNSQFNHQTEVDFYPNPVENILNFTNVEEIKKIEIYDLLGKKSIENHSNFSQIDLTKLEKGVYLVKVITKNGNLFTRKIIKQ